MSTLPNNTYCSIARGHEYHGPYHDHEYGFPVESDDLLFERLMLEINQAGLSWLTILRKRDGLRSAYDQFAIEQVAEYGDEDRARLMQDSREAYARLMQAVARADKLFFRLRKVLALIHRRNVFLVRQVRQGRGRRLVVGGGTRAGRGRRHG